MASTCGVCRFCRTGRENLCEKATFTGRDRDGGYAERIVARAEWIYRLPAGFSALEAAPLLCAGIIGYRSLRLSGIQPGGRLGLFGFGASAHLAIQVAHYWRCEVFVFTREEHHRRLAVKMGAAWAGGGEDDPGAALDAAVTFAPAGDLVPVALSRLDRGGALAINAIHMSPIPSFPYELLYGERRVVGITNYTRRDAEEFLELAARIPIRAETEIFPLEKANEALLRIKRGEVRGAAVLEIR
jgi:propanol-preferring alcohol dehydrogenase